MPPSELPELPNFLKPKLRLFLSVDIVNSTSFKQSTRRSQKNDPKGGESPPAEEWFLPIVDFYREIERLFSQEWLRISSVAKTSYDWDAGPDPILWKSAGDEVFYVKVLTDYRQALIGVWAWMCTITAHRKTMRGKTPSLDLKAAAWLAGFPVNNAEVVLRSAVGREAVADDDDAIISNLKLLEKNEYSPQGFTDFIGPSVDTGFRIATTATPRKFPVTLDLALLLSQALLLIPAQDPVNPHHPALEFKYDGKTTLKGVMDGTPYPIFWIDMEPEDQLNNIEDELLNVRTVDSNRVKQFVELFIQKARKGYLIRPFIAGVGGPFSDVPEYHVSRLQHLATYWKNELEKKQREEESADNSEAEDSQHDGYDDVVKLVLEKVQRSVSGPLPSATATTVNSEGSTPSQFSSES